MARPRAPERVRLFAGLLSNDPDLMRRARQQLTKILGPVDLESDLWPFDQTDYYEPEMGPDLQRRFISFEIPVPPDVLPEIKLATNGLEQQIADEALLPDIARPVNIDPGYIDLTKLVLATTKDRGHRIYLARGIFAEVTLQYTAGNWQALPWTYPDYTSPEYHAFFTRVRDRLQDQRRELPNPPATEA
jgi:hypothetical protein